jgi:hypothetical protein
MNVRGHLRACAVTVLLALTAAAATAHAQARTVRLEYERGRGAELCPSAQELRNGVMARLGRDPFRDSDTRRVRVTITAAGNGVAATVVVRDERGRPAGERRLTSSHRDCAELAAAIGLAIAIVIDPLGAWGRRAERWDEAAAASQPQSAPAPVDPPGPVARPVPVELPTFTSRPEPPPEPVEVRRPVPPPPRPPVPLNWFASAGPLLSLGAAPRVVTAGLAVQVAARRGALSLALEARADYPREATVGDGAVSAFVAAGALVPCFHLNRFAFCGVFMAGALRGGSRDLFEARSDATPWAAAGARLAVEVGLGQRWALRLQGDLLAPFTRTTLSVGAEDVWKTPPVSGAFGLVVAARLR